MRACATDRTVVPPTAIATGVSVLAAVALLVALAPILPVTGPFLAPVAVALAIQAGVFVLAARFTDGTDDRFGDGPELRFTLATAVTVVRGTIAAALAGFLAVGRPEGVLAWLPAALFAVSALLDGIDGVIARAMDDISAFGSQLDADIDGFTLLVGAAVVVGFDLAPLVYLSVGLARFAFVGGCTWRRRRGAAVQGLPSSPLRPALFVVQLCVVFAVLTPLFPADVSVVLTTAATVPFLAMFLHDWLVVSGRFER